VTTSQDPEYAVPTKSVGLLPIAVSAALVIVNMLVFFVELLPVTDAVYGDSSDPASGDIVTPIVLIITGHIFVTGAILLCWKRSRRVGCGMMIGSPLAVVLGLVILFIGLQGLDS
jgi:uncharacterized protein (DUF983 family)